MVGERNDEVLDPAVELAGVDQPVLLRPTTDRIGIDAYEGAVPAMALPISRAGVAHERCRVLQVIQHTCDIRCIVPVGWIAVPPPIKKARHGLHVSVENDAFAAGI